MTKKEKQRQSVYEKYGGHCAYCGEHIEYKDMQVDHVNPKRNGGVDSIENNDFCTWEKDINKRGRNEKAK